MDAAYAIARKLQGRCDMAGNTEYSRGIAGYRICFARPVFCCRRCGKSGGSLTEVKKPEHALKLFIRFALAKGVITYGLELMLKLMVIVQGVISKIMTASGIASSSSTALPQSIIDAIEDCGFWESIPLWAVTLIGGLFITVLSFIMIMSVYGRFFKIYMYSAIAPVPLSTFAGQPTENVGKTFLKSYCAVLLEGAIIVLACVIFSVFASSPADGRYFRSSGYTGVELCG